MGGSWPELPPGTAGRGKPTLDKSYTIENAMKLTPGSAKHVPEQQAAPLTPQRSYYENAVYFKRMQ